MRKFDANQPQLLKKKIVYITLLYAAAGLLWMLLFDHIAGCESDLSRAPHLHVWKDWLYVVITAVLLYICLLHFTGIISRKEKVVQENTQRYWRLVESSPLGIAVHGEGLFLFVNNEYARIMGASKPEQLIGKTVMNFIHPHYRDVVRERIQLSTGGSETPLIEEKFVRLDGTVIDVEVITLPIIYDGTPVVQQLIRDITWLKQVEEENLKSRQQMSQIINSLPDPTFAIDQEGKVIAWNLAMEKLTGVKAKSILGKGDNEYALPIYGHRRPVLINQALQSGGRLEKKYSFLQPCGQGADPYPSLARDRELVYWCKATPLSDGQENILGAIESMRDVTAITRMSSALAAEQEKFLIILRSIGEGVITTDIEGKISLVNKVAEKITGWCQEEAAGKPLTAVLQVINESEDTTFPLNKLTQQFYDQLEVIGRDGSKKMLSASRAPILDKGSNALGFVLIVRDVTELKKNEARLALSQKLESIGQLAAGIAHEINSPMQYIGDNLSFLQESFAEIADIPRKYRDLLEAGADAQKIINCMKEWAQELDIDYLADEVPRAIEQSLEGVDKVHRIIGAMKDFSHPGYKEKQLTDINGIIEGTITISRNEWKYASEMHTDLDPELPSIPCQQEEINQVILNMIINSAHAIEEAQQKGSCVQGNITIKTRAKESFLEITISDNGIGIPPGVIPKIFDPFFTTKKIGKGTGQGLALAHDIVVHKHQGDISIESEENVGTTFVIRLPITRERREVH